MRLASVFLIIGVTLQFSGASANDLSAAERTIYAQLIAQEFKSVCIDNDANADRIKKMADDRGWFPRPVDITDAVSPPDYAWDAETSLMPIGQPKLRDKYTFVLGVTNSALLDECYIVIPLVGYDVVRNAMSNQGMKLLEERDWSRGSDVYKVAHFALVGRGNLLEQSFGMDLTYRKSRFRSGFDGVRMRYCHGPKDSYRGCYAYLDFGIADGPGRPETIIEPWLGQKAVSEPPGPVDE